MSMQAKGTFTVEMKQQSAPHDPIGRFCLFKHYEGDLAASGVGEMLTIRTDVEGSAGYVAMERVSGHLLGRSGTFALQHAGLMDRQAPTLSVTVIPDSATGGLAGMTGDMSIEIAAGQHSYVFRYNLPEIKSSARQP